MKLSDLEDYSKLDARFDHLDNRIERLENKLDARFNQLEARLGKLENLIWIPVAAAIAQIVIAFLK